MARGEFSPRGTIVSMSVIAALIAWTYIRQPVRKHVVFTGSTMGTTYEVKLPNADLTPRGIRRVQDSFDDVLNRINAEMSTYLPDSEITAFNQSTSTAPFRVSLEFAHVVRQALEFSQATDGAFDPTVLPLVHAWGFGSSTNAPTPPSAETLAHISSQIGYDKISAPTPYTIQKSVPGLQLDLGAIAKGYAVDQIAHALGAATFTNYYINIGGEIRTSGTSTNASPWTIAIETPVPSGKQHLYEILELKNHAMATSGDYRNFYVGNDGNHYAHIIDPLTGKPVTHQLASVSVIAPTCIEADALATALYVMGPQRGMAWVEAHDGIEAFFIVRDRSEDFRHAATPGFKSLIRK